MEILSKKNYIIGAVLGILALLMIVFLLEEIKKDSQKIISQKEKSILLEGKKKELKNLQKEYESAQENLEKIDSFFVDLALPIEFIRLLEKSGFDSQISTKVSLATEKTGPEPALSFNVSLSGSFANLLKFIDKIENSPYLIEVANLDVKKSTQEPLGNIIANLELVVLAK